MGAVEDELGRLYEVKTVGKVEFPVNGWLIILGGGDRQVNSSGKLDCAIIGCIAHIVVCVLSIGDGEDTVKTGEFE